MNIYIMVDIEGISGIYCKEQVSPEGGRFQEGRERMTADINACVEACKEAGADKVYVRDGHGGSYSVLYDKLTDKADYYICGRTYPARYVGIEEFDGVILLGYHAMAGTPEAVLEHSMSSSSIQNYWLNGTKVGEVTLDAVGVGAYGIPIIMVSGDDKVCAETKRFLPWAVTCEVKKGTNWSGAMLLPEKKALAEIRRCTKEAIAKLSSMQVYQIAKPMTLRTELMERGQLPSPLGKPYLKIIDGRTYEITADTMEELLSL